VNAAAAADDDDDDDDNENQFDVIAYHPEHLQLIMCLRLVLQLLFIINIITCYTLNAGASLRPTGKHEILRCTGHIFAIDTADCVYLTHSFGANLANVAMNYYIV